MALDQKILHLSCELYKRGFFKNIKSVIDMGDQDLNINFEQLKKNLEFLNIKDLDGILNQAKKYPERPRLSSSFLWKILGIENTDRLDLIKLERVKEDSLNNFFKVDLNYPLEDQIKFTPYDFVTDFGNNEHPFNVVESYKSMHKLCKENGFMLIHQGIFGGNGFYNFDISFFENLAAVNDYSCLYSSLAFAKKDHFFSTPVDRSYFKMVDIKNIDVIEIIYIFQKKSNKDFVYPYQGSGKSIENSEYYTNKLNTVNSFPSRMYIPNSYNDLSLTTFIKYLKNKLLKR